jgi:penicillin-binding protein 1C
VLTVLAVRRGRAAALAALAFAALGVWIRCMPVPAELLAGVETPSAVVVDRHGRVLYEALSTTGSRVTPLDAASLPPLLEAATIAAEDRRFFSHPGVDPISLVRAARQNVVEGRIVEGGSTISQQVAKLLIQRHEGVKPRGFRAKVREMILALRLEHRFSKREVLALYLNLASYGNQATGVGRASQVYFGVDPSMLTPAQAAFLAALPQRPGAFNPWRNIASARARQHTVLRRMAAAGALTTDRLSEARAEQLLLRPRHAAFGAPHFVEMVSRDSVGRIETTLDLDLQREVQGIIAHERASLVAHGASNVAVVVLDNARGEWLAWEGSGDYSDVEHGGTINGPLVPRQPGSALKPFTYALAFEHGRGPASVLPDIPSHFPTAEAGILYSPRNYDGRYRGPLLARRALAGSENVPAVALAADVGVSSLLRFLDRAGLSTFDRTPAYYGLGVTLGNAEVRLDELVAAYAAFARGGVWKKPTAIFQADGKEKEDERRLVSARTAFWITDILADDEARAYAFGRGSHLAFPFPVAVKTGTSQAYHDNWTIGYTKDVTVGVWVGNFDRKPLRNSSGVTGAGPIFHAVMVAATRGRPSATAHEIVARPDDVDEASICELSGMRAGAWCPSRKSEWTSGGEDPVPCAWHHRGDEGLVTIYPPEYRAWAAATTGEATASRATASAISKVVGAVREPPITENGPKRTRVESDAIQLHIANPPEGAIYSIDPTLRRDFQAIPLRVVTSRPTTVMWLVDGTRIGTASSEQSLAWPLAVGAHQIEARDAAGRRATTSVIVR